MFFVVESSAEGVVGFVILTPVSELLHRKIISGELYDLYDFPLSEVPKEEMRSEYYFVSDICLSKQKAYSYIQAVSKLLGNTLKIMWEKAKIVTACPVTQEGLKIDESIGMRKVAEAFHDGKKYPIHLIEVTQEGFSRFQRIISQA